MADGVFWIVSPAPPLTVVNQFCIFEGGVESISLAACAADDSLRMMSEASTLILPGETLSATSSASVNRASSAALKPTRSKVDMSPATLKVVWTTDL